MNNETMLTVSIKAFSDNKKEELSFETIFQYVKNRFIEKWTLENNGVLSEDKLLEKKRGELYKLLTVDKTFNRLADGNWLIIHNN
ncbi:DNA-directed RNA polymerase subunit delta [Mycoplasma zalophi]|uniref:Uncharacterized protein n=1 Tax=Mycoplasma zalophi TaxID=191287 RepID=A0ABS6DQS3_9MOLU|nr:hypothetical protein [Mycoplasma zalophi]MBU4691296.1 hypothetical protein [Mycoplasma zalophi]MBU4692498.1 hypothetical protein [Mycoplasma zalophi]